MSLLKAGDASLLKAGTASPLKARGLPVDPYSLIQVSAVFYVDNDPPSVTVIDDDPDVFDVQVY